jgi:hypothetical protein
LLYDFFAWCEATFIGEMIRNSVWAFPAIETVHVLGIAMMLGTVFLVDLRNFGLGLKRMPLSHVARQMSKWTAIGLGATLISGVLMFLSEAIKCYNNDAFPYKMAFLFGAILMQYTVRRKVTSSDDITAISKITACVSIALWLGVFVSGRMIGFV